MSAGLPGLGLGGLFFIFSALLAPFGELWRTVRGRSRPGEWRAVARQFAQAVTMVIAIDLTLRLIYVGLSLAGTGDVPSAASGTVLPLTLIGITTALVAIVVSAAKAVQLGFRLRRDGPPRLPHALPRPAPLRALSAAAATVAWVALLSVGASELSPLAMPPDAASSRAGERDLAGISSSDRVIRPRWNKVSLEISSVPVSVPDAGRAAAPGPAETGPEVKSGTPPSPSAPPTTSISAPAPSDQVHGPPPAATQTFVPEGAASQPQAAGAPATSSDTPTSAGPPEGSSAPEHAGPPPEVPAVPERGGAPEESPASEHAGAELLSPRKPDGR
jgi:hypothetical protein